jgi:chondroitin sulfate N-acetylgalactosaminyltransferase 1/2
MLEDQNNVHGKEIQKLKQQIAALQEEVRQRAGKISRIMKNADDDNEEEETENFNVNRDFDQRSDTAGVQKMSVSSKKRSTTDLGKFIEQKIKGSEIINGVSLNTEYDLTAFDRFTINRVYLSHLGLGKRVVERPIGFKKKDLHEVLMQALETLNKNRGKKPQFTGDHFVEGLYRTEPSMGTHYELYFKNIDSTAEHGYRKLVLTRPFAPVQLVLDNTTETDDEVINLILPLSGSRIDTFHTFMDYFKRVCIKADKRIFLTIVYFGSYHLDTVKAVIATVERKFKFRLIKLVSLNETFSRGRGLQVGVQSWTKGDVLMFLCDVDIIFTTDFLERCRLNAIKGLKVYYPMVFSLYNPSVVYTLQDNDIPPRDKQLVISKATGFWRDFGYGMTCQYRSDFLAIGGFEEKITGWGMEDVLLYRKYVKSRYLVVRSPDPGIFHMWHEKHCDPELPVDQYRGCIQSRALNEASHEQLGMLAFKNEIEQYKHLKENRERSQLHVPTHT